jgi:hypothetical protein
MYTADASGFLGCDIMSLDELLLMLQNIINTPSKAQNHSPINSAALTTNHEIYTAVSKIKHNNDNKMGRKKKKTIIMP